MSTLRWKWALVILLVGIFGFYLLPTIRYHALPADRKASPDPKVAGLREGAMRLGLDLQGGSYLVYSVDLAKIPEKDRRGDEVDRAIEIIRNRVDQFGVAEPVIQRQGESRIVVQLPGLQDPERAKELVGKTALLEFRLVKTRQELFQALSIVDQAWSRRMKGEAALSDSARADSLAADSTLASANPFSGLLQQIGRGDEGFVYCPAENLEKALKIVAAIATEADGDRPRPLAGGTVLVWGEREFGAGTQNPGRYLYALTARPDLTGEHVTQADVRFGMDTNKPNSPGVLLNLDKRGAGIFTRLTGNNVGRQLAIVLDNRVKSAPVIRDKIRGGTASITGLSGDAEAKDLGIVLRAGALPTDLKIEEERTVGPSLGRDSIQDGVRASLVGAVFVVLFMAVYYRLSGLIAIYALALNIFFLFGGLGMLRATLTLPGIAGVALTIGMAVDANILIFERIREELRNGKTIRGAIDAGYSRAIVTILDANLTTLISAVVLYQFGTGPVRGFAITLMIGLVANLFTAIFATRVVYDTILANRELKKLSI